MKILWAKAGGLVPPQIGGKIRSYHILRELAKSHSVTLFTFYAAHPNDLHPQLTGVFDRVVYCPLRISSDRGLGELAGFLGNTFSSWPHSVSKYCRSEAQARFREVLKSDSYDAIVCDFVFAAGVIPWDEISCPTLLFTHNVEALIWKRHFEIGRNPLWKLVCWGEYQKMIRFERFCLAKSSRVLTVSEADRIFFSRFIDPSKMTVIPTGVDTDYFLPSTEDEETPDSLVFTGAMDWMPNEDGVVHFLHSVLPLIRREIPNVTFTVVGRNPSDGLRARAAETAGVRVTGTVEDIRPYVRDASVYVVPLRVGSGTRLKIFEAMAMGKAVVSTKLGAEGLPVTDGYDLLLAESPDELAEKIVLLLRDPVRRKSLGLRARQLVEEHYSWPMVAAEFDAVLRSMTRVQESSCATAVDR
jgi:sugar transferase (PEP-CTERM/EpsH1 system associated)